MPLPLSYLSSIFLLTTCALGLDVPLLTRAPPLMNRVMAVDPGRIPTGALFEGVSIEPLQPGRYRLHCEVAMGPLGGALGESVTLSLKAGDKVLTRSAIHLLAADHFIPLTLDIILARPTSLLCSLTYTAKAEAMEMEERKRQGGPKLGVTTDELLGESEAEGELKGLGELEETGIRELTLDDARKLPRRLMIRSPWLEELLPVAITAVTDRIVYRTFDEGNATFTLRSCSATPLSVTMTGELFNRLLPARRLMEKNITLEPDKTIILTETFVCRDLSWGGEVRLQVTASGKTEEVRAVFAVHDNPWAVALMSSAQNLQLNRLPGMTPAQAEARIHAERSRGFTGFEAFFWAPCDMFNYTPTQERFFGCQGGYTGSRTATKNLIEAAHAQGFFTTLYANLWGGAGQTGFDLMRKHPDWYGQGNFDTRGLHDMELMDSGKMEGENGIWYYNQIDPVRGEQAFDRHAQEIIAGHKAFGWDGIRYDSYYSSDWTKRATARVRQIVEAEYPQYRWGYNSLTMSDRNSGALDIMVGGGHLIMEEGLALTIDSVTPITRYADTILRFRDIIWPHGGHLGLIFRGAQEKPNAVDTLYAASLLLAGGAHPYYNPLDTDLGSLMPFALRHSEIFWDNQLVPLKAAKEAVHFSGSAPFFWDRLARTRRLPDGGYRLILHLLNIPLNHTFQTDWGNRLAAPLPAQTIRLALTDTTPLRSAHLLYPFETAEIKRLKTGSEKGRVAISLPEFRFWCTLVLDYESNTPIPAADLNAKGDYSEYE